MHKKWWGTLGGFGAGVINGLLGAGGGMVVVPLLSAMAEYPVNKGIGRSVEFKGLKAQYLFIFCGGLLALFVLFVILYMIGIDQWFCIGFGVVSASVLVWQTFALNARYGEHGLMKLGAARSHPRYILNRRKISRLFNRKKQKNEKYT